MSKEATLGDDESPPMTVDWIRERLAYIAGAACDPPSAHEDEDLLHRAVLHAIAEGRCEDPAACAAEALKSLHIPFHRWYE